MMRSINLSMNATILLPLKMVANILFMTCLIFSYELSKNVPTFSIQDLKLSSVAITEDSDADRRRSCIR
uniref:Uncharacterized protein n=1 Tax=Cryptosporidium parvum TaxID=5807 RepID=F0X5W5_CRYPV